MQSYGHKSETKVKSENLLLAEEASPKEKWSEGKSFRETWQLHALPSIYKVGLWTALLPS